MPLAVRRVGGISEASQTYTLGPQEAFRLDSASFSIDYANEGSYVIPTLIARDKGGFLIAEIEAPALLGSPPILTGFTFSGPAAMADAFELALPDGYGGYLFHDFGAGVTTSQITMNWPQPPGLAAFASELWLSSPGAASMGPIIGTATVTDTDTVTVTLTAPVAAGRYLMLHTTIVGTARWASPPVTYRPLVTDSVGGNIIDYPDALTAALAFNTLQRSDGLWFSTYVEFYRIVNPLGVGATVTLQNRPGAPLWMQLNVNAVTGLTVGSPRGPNAGGNYAGTGQQANVSPHTGTENPVPKWVGPVLIIDNYVVPAGGSMDVQFARGGVEIEPLFGTAFATSPVYVQAPLPELHLTPFSTLTATTKDTTSTRYGDLISDFLVYGVDD